MQRPVASSEVAARRMSRQARRETKPEVELRRELHRRGLRYRVHVSLRVLPRRRVDIVFSRARVAVFVDGCFWHSCPQHATAPKSNGPWWADKLGRNVARDRETDRTLTEAGWLVIRVWEHEPAPAAADRVEAAVRGVSTG